MSPLLDVFFPPFFLIVTWLCWVPAVARGIVHSCSASILWLWRTGSSFPCGRWDPSSLTRNQTRTPCTAKQTPNHWTTREVPPSISKEIISSQSGRCSVPLFLLFSVWWKPGFCPHNSREMVPLGVTVTWWCLSASSWQCWSLPHLTVWSMLITLESFPSFAFGGIISYGSSLSSSISSFLSYLPGFYPPCTSSLWISAKQRTQMTLLWVTPL